MNVVSVAACENYEPSEVDRALREAVDAAGGLDWVKPGMKIAIKANLVTFMKPESAATTHPEALCALVRLLKARGAEVVVGDSPGGLYTAAYVNRIYSVTGMHRVEEVGATLNHNFGEVAVEFPQAKIAKTFTCTAWLKEVDAIINFCKLKTHGMMCMSAAVKNLFGTIPGTMKPEYHFRYPNERDFADMLVDLNEYFRPKLSIVDAVVGMEGNGPTAGVPRKIGALLASQNPHALDLACAAVIGVTMNDVPTLRAAYERGLCPDSWEKLELHGDLNAVKVPDFDNIQTKRSLRFQGNGKGLSKLTGEIMARLLSSRPALQPQKCVGCGVCAKTCPAKAIDMGSGKPKIDRAKCIRCFCCQEFCPKGALEVRRPPIARLLNREK